MGWPAGATLREVPSKADAKVDRLRRDEFEIDDDAYARLRRAVVQWRSRTLDLHRRSRDLGIDH
jgi:hypothetical protein